MQNGEKLRLFSSDIDQMYTNFEAIVFQVVSPQKFDGFFFRLENETNAWGTAEGIWPLKYRIGEMYSFPLQIASGLFRIDTGTNGYASSVIKNPGRRYYTNIKEAEEQLRSLQSRIESLRPKVSFLEEELKKTPPADKKSVEYSHWRKMKGRYWDLRYTLQGREYELEELKQQVLHLRILESQKKDKP